MQKEELKGIALLTGTIVGAGVLGIPYVVSQSGFTSGLILLIILALMTLLINLYMGEIILRTKMYHELTGYAEKYLGKKGKFLLTISMTSIVLGALVAYLIGEGASLANLFPFFSPGTYTLIFFIIVTIILFFGLEAVANSELIFGFFMISSISLIIFLSLFHVDLNNLTGFAPNINAFFIPYGVILFAYLGVEALPEVVVELAHKKKSIKKIIIIGSLMPLILYSLFALAVVGVTGKATTQVATIGLGHTLGNIVLVLGSLFSIVAMATSYLALGLALIWMLHLDYNMNKKLSWLIISIIPLIIFLFGWTNFIQVMSVSGAIFGGLQCILIVLMFYKAKKLSERKPEYTLPWSNILAILLILIYGFGILYQFL